MSETELEKKKARTTDHFENDKSNISWLKEGKFSWWWFDNNMKIVLLFINTKYHRRKKYSNSKKKD